MMGSVASQITLQSIIYKRNKRLSQLANDHRKPLNQAVFAPLPTGNRARTAYLHCIKDDKNIEELPLVIQKTLATIQFNWENDDVGLSSQ